MKGDNDDYLTWPIKGTLTVQLLNQLSDSNHSEPVKFHYNRSSRECQRVMTDTISLCLTRDCLMMLTRNVST